MTRREHQKDQHAQPRVNAVALAAPTFAYTGHEIIFSVFLPAWLATQFGLNIAVVGAFLLFLKIWDTLNDPVMGAISDATQSRFGRRKLWMFRGVPLVLISTTLVFLIPTLNSALLQLSLLFVLTAGWTMVNVPHGAWALEAGQTPKDSARIFGYRTIAGLFAAPCFLFIPFVLERAGYTEPRLHIAVMAALIIVCLPISLIILTRQVADQSGQGSLSLKMMTSDYRDILLRRENWRLFAMFALAGVAFSIQSGLYIFLIKYTFLLEQWATSFLFIQTLFAIIGIFSWIKIHSLINTKRTLKFIILSQVFCSIILFVLPAANLYFYIALSILKGLITGALFMILRVILSQSIIASEQKTKAGTYYAAYHLVFNLSAALATFGVFAGLSMMGFDPKSPVTDHFGLTLRAIAGGGELCAALGLLLISRKLRV